MPDQVKLAAGLPLFYAAPVPLSGNAHGAWRLLPGDAAFAAAEPAAPLSASEFGAAARCYPILFTADVTSPVALMGLDRANLFVTDGRWAEGAYVPAYIRRYPFLLIEAADKSGFALAIDEASPQLAKSGRKGQPLFVKGEPADVTKQALEFCRLFNLDHVHTRAFCAALDDADVLIDRRANVALPDGRTLGVQGFKVVDPEKFAALPDDMVIAWHRQGWLALVHFHLASLERFTDLLVRQGRRDGNTLAEAPTSVPLQ
jgi:hypothetical protein